MKDRPTCFVAMAFDHADTDNLYTKGILPVLRELKIAPVIINKKQFNDDVTSQIMTSIDEADLCIADLTYARQSVYYEAGYAERKITTIYTVRKDHFRSLDDSQRVHFDLSVRPIIEWTSGDFARFRSRLRARVQATFLRKWNANRAEDLQWTEESEDFLGGSLYIQRYLMIREAIKTLRSMGVRNWYTPDYKSHKLKKYRNPLRINVNDFNYEQFYLSKGHTYSIASIHAARDLSLNDFKDIASRSTRDLSNEEIYADISKRRRGSHCNLVSLVLTINKVNPDRFRKLWTHAELAQPNVILFDDVIDVPWGSDNKISVTRIYVFVSSIKHRSEISEKLKEVKEYLT